ncbi:uncharacterized protein LOC118432252 isoform X1 [Branchiostoma floridae]|uniref:Uncharacterized protein LOC118432252 isoform X1 n=1 Tax=Branchiostoma floridae TaxID=7739 RepID=A0A9J7MGM7_BRAFL|nr:uncharacterized protein LOC118432252 isoform X1 [Branchiostoma floridae]
MARFGTARQEDKPTAGKKASERAKHRASQPFEKFSGWDVSTDFDDLSLDVWAKQTSQNRPNNSRRNEKIPSKYLCRTETRCSGLQSPGEFSIVTLAEELKEDTQLVTNHDAGHRDDFTIQKRAIEKELVAQKSDRQNTQTIKLSAKNENSHFRQTQNGSTRNEHLDELRGSKSINSATFSKLLSISSSRNHDSGHVSREPNGHLAENVNDEQAAIEALKIQNGKTSTQETKASKSPVEKVSLPSVRFTYTKAKDPKQRPESGISFSSSTTEQTEGSGSSFSTLRTIESSDGSKSLSSRSDAVTTTGSSSEESGTSKRSPGPELPPVNPSPSPTLMTFPSDGIAKFFTSWARSFAESVSNDDDQDLPTDIFARYSRNKRATFKPRPHNSARENVSNLQHLKDSRTSRSAPSLSTAEDAEETSKDGGRDSKFGDGAVSPSNYPIRDVLPDGISVQRGLPGRKLKAPDVSGTPTKISLQQGWREDDLTGWSTPPMYQGDVIIVKDGIDLEKLRDQNTNGPPAFRPHHLKTPLQRARDIVQRRLGNPATQAEISTSPTASPPRRWKSSYSNMYEPTKQRSGDLRTQSEQSPRAHSKHALGQHDVCDPGQRVNSRPSRDGVHQKAGNPPPLRDRHELASRDPWNYVMQYMGRVPAVKTSSNVLRH